MAEKCSETTVVADSDQRFLASSDAIDWRKPSVSAKAAELAAGESDIVSVAERCFHFVRDEIDHCWDYQREAVTFRASEVLEHRTGWCYAKAHLLAALLRANGVPAGLCYQRLSVEGEGAPYCLHGLNAVKLPDTGWYRIDARGNKEGVEARFTPPVERLAFTPAEPGEKDLQEIWAEPHPEVRRRLTECRSNREVFERLPDCQAG